MKSLSKDKIIEIAQSSNCFMVHRYLYREENIRKKCRILAKEGKIKFSHIHHKHIVYGPMV